MRNLWAHAEQENNSRGVQGNKSFQLSTWLQSLHLHLGQIMQCGLLTTSVCVTNHCNKRPPTHTAPCLRWWANQDTITLMLWWPTQIFVQQLIITCPNNNRGNSEVTAKHLFVLWCGWHFSPVKELQKGQIITWVVFTSLNPVRFCPSAELRPLRTACVQMPFSQNKVLFLQSHALFNHTEVAQTDLQGVHREQARSRGEPERFLSGALISLARGTLGSRAATGGQTSDYELVPSTAKSPSPSRTCCLPADECATQDTRSIWRMYVFSISLFICMCQICCKTLPRPPQNRSSCTPCMRSNEINK